MGPPLRSLKQKRNNAPCICKAFDVALMTRVQQMSFQGPFFSTRSLLSLWEGNICSGFRMPRKELQKPDSVRERITAGPEVPGHQRTAITCKAPSWDVPVRQPWAFQRPGLGDICNAVLACDSLRTHCAQLSTQQMEMEPQMECVMLCITS